MGQCTCNTRCTQQNMTNNCRNARAQSYKSSSIHANDSDQNQSTKSLHSHHANLQQVPIKCVAISLNPYNFTAIKKFLEQLSYTVHVIAQTDNKFYEDMWRSQGHNRYLNSHKMWCKNYLAIADSLYPKA